MRGGHTGIGLDGYIKDVLGGPSNPLSMTRGGSSPGYTPPKREAAQPVVGDVNIRQGSHMGTARMVTDTILPTDKGNPILYHIKVLGVKAAQVAGLDAQQLAQVARSLNSYQ